MTTPTSAEGFAAPYWAALEQEQLVIQRCTDCSELQMYPRRSCISCGASELTFEPASGNGSLYSFTTVVKYPPSDFVGDLPYTLGIVHLTEGPRMLARIVGATDDELRCDMPVKLTTIRVNGKLLPAFQPAVTAVI
jgi:uncharacterized protein